jgi:HAD superfamily hydrolase (TIGR01509 family)
VSTNQGPSIERAPEWLLLDIGGVLETVDDRGRRETFAARWAPPLGLSPDQFITRLSQADLPNAARQLGVAEEYWRRFGEALEASSEQLASMRADFWDDYCGTANDELVTYLAQLHGQVGLAILSNSGDGAREEEERRYGFSRLFDPICYSHEIGVTKPDEAAFRIALEQMSAHPSAVLFIDDVGENVAAARKIGVRAHLHVDNQNTIDAIERSLSITDP